MEIQKAHCEHLIHVIISCIQSFAAIDPDVTAVNPRDYSREIYLSLIRSVGTLKAIEFGIIEKLQASAELAKRIDTARVAKVNWEKHVKSNRRKGNSESLKLFQGREPATSCSLD